MKTLTQTITEAHQYALSIRPKVGGFPVIAEVFRQAGVTLNRWSLPSCQSVYLTKQGAAVQQGTPLVTGLVDVPVFNREALIAAIRTDQQGLSSFPEFLMSTWQAGVIGYDVDFVNRKVSYYGVSGETYTEEYPAVDVRR